MNRPPPPQAREGRFGQWDCIVKERVAGIRRKMPQTPRNETANLTIQFDQQRERGIHMTEPGKPQSPQPTSSLKQFDILIGQWEMVGTHPGFSSPKQGHSVFEWMVDGALLIWRFNWEPSGPPNAISVIGHDDMGEACSM